MFFYKTIGQSFQNMVKFFRYNNDTNDDFIARCIISDCERTIDNYKYTKNQQKEKYQSHDM